MKKLTILFFISLLFSINIRSQDKIEEVKLASGKTIVIYSDFTWKYKQQLVSDSISSNKASTSNGVKSTTSKSQLKTTTKSSNTKSTVKSNYSGYCGAPTKKGGSCKRRVSGGGRCWQHK